MLKLGLSPLRDGIVLFEKLIVKSLNTFTESWGKSQAALKPVWDSLQFALVKDAAWDPAALMPKLTAVGGLEQVTEQLQVGHLASTSVGV